MPNEGARVLASLNDQGPGRPGSPLFVERDFGEGRTVIWNSSIDADWNLFAESPASLIPLTHEVCFGAARPAGPSRNLDVGDSLSAEFPFFPEAPTLVRPDGSSLGIASDAEESQGATAGRGSWLLIDIATPDAPGIWSLRTSSGTDDPFAVTLHASEGDLARISSNELMGLHPALVATSEVESEENGGEDNGGELWRGVLLLVLACLVGEALWGGTYREAHSRSSVVSCFLPPERSAQDPVITQGLATSFELLEAPSAWVVVLVILPLVGLVVWASYGRRLLESNGHRALGLLRGLAIFAVLFLLARPALVEERQEIRPAEVIVLFDDSASMGSSDPWAGDAEAHAALSALTGLDPASSTRSELAREALGRHLLPVLEKRGYIPHLYTFAEGWTPADASTFTPASKGSASHLGDAVLGSLGANTARHVTDVIVIGDGRTTGGTPLVDAARRASAAGVPVHTLLTGDARPETGAKLELVDAPSTAMDDDEIAIHLRLTGQGQGTRRVDVRLEELESADDESGEFLMTSPFDWTAKGSASHWSRRVPKPRTSRQASPGGATS